MGKYCPLLIKLKYDRQSYNWASEASPTLGCSIDISLDVYRISSNSFRGINFFQVLTDCGY